MIELVEGVMRLRAALDKMGAPSYPEIRLEHREYQALRRTVGIIYYEKTHQWNGFVSMTPEIEGFQICGVQFKSKKEVENDNHPQSS